MRSKGKAKAFIFKNSNSVGTDGRFTITKATMGLLHRCLAANDCIRFNVRSNAVYSLSLLDEPLVPGLILIIDQTLE